jgi:mono/diheme cytochrome c family protein
MTRRILGVLAAAMWIVPAASAQSPADIYKDVYNGWKWWHVYCYRCHGTDATGTPTAPGFIEANRAMSAAEFLRKVRNGIPDTAMQSWSKLLDDRQIAQIYLYVKARTEKVLPPGRPDEAGPKGSPWVPPAGWPKQK